MSINFTARYIKPVEVKKQAFTGYKPAIASFVEFEPSNENDLTTLKRVSDSWGRTYAERIYNDAVKGFLQKNDKHFYYGIVTPQDSYQKVDKKDVLGLVEYVPLENYGNYIYYLQVNPDLMHKSPFRQKISNIFSAVKNVFNASNSNNSNYKGIGTGILDVLKSMSKDVPIFLISDKDAEEFYLKNGFTRTGENSDCFVWYESDENA